MWGLVRLGGVVLLICSSALGCDEGAGNVHSPAASGTKRSVIEHRLSLRCEDAAVIAEPIPLPEWAGSGVDPQVFVDEFPGILLGGAGVVADFDGDDQLDLFFAGGLGDLALFLNDGTGRGFVASAALDSVTLSDDASTNGANALDLDSDGDLDLLLHRSSGVVVLRNDGDLFIDVSGDFGLDTSGQVIDGSATDYDRDGQLDLFLNHSMMPGDPGSKGQLFHGLEGGGFEFVPSFAAQPQSGGFSLASTWVDLDRDGWEDLLLLRDKLNVIPNAAYRNQPGSATPLLFDAELSDALAGVTGSMGIGVLDADGDGLEDLFIADATSSVLYIAASQSSEYIESSVARGADFGDDPRRSNAWGVSAEDFDGDGWTDLHIAFSMHSSDAALEPDALLRNRGGGFFEEVSADYGLDDLGLSRGSLTGDFDRDGVPDIAIAVADGSPALYRMPCNGAHRLAVQLRGPAGNTYAIGARLRVEAGGRSWERTLRAGTETFGQRALELYFGLGEAREIDRISIRWPDGLEEDFEGVEVDQLIRIVRGERDDSR